MDSFQYMQGNGVRFFSTFTLSSENVDRINPSGSVLDYGKNEPGFWCPKQYEATGQFAWIPQDECCPNFKPLKCEIEDFCNRRTPEVRKIMNRF